MFLRSNLNIYTYINRTGKGNYVILKVNAFFLLKTNFKNKFIKQYVYLHCLTYIKIYLPITEQRKCVEANQYCTKEISPDGTSTGTNDKNKNRI